LASRKKTLLDLAASELGDRRALVRVDFNVPLQGDPPQIRDAGRIEAALPTLDHLRKAGARLVLMSHLGRPKGKPDAALSLRPVARALSTRLGAAVDLVGDPSAPGAAEATARLPRGGVMLLENLRFWPGETANDPVFAAALARLGDVYVQDAFGTVHRAHASTVGVPKILRPAVSGLLVARELDAFERLLGAPERPYVAILGGAKISGKLETLQAILARADRVLVGGGMASTFYRAMGYEVGASLVEPDLVPTARSLLESPNGGKLLLAEDVVVAPALAAGAPTRVVEARDIPADASVGDIGPAARERFAVEVGRARLVFWNGPMGVFEIPAFAEGTLGLARAVARATETGAFTVVGGGDSAAALTQMGLEGGVSHLSTGGGAGLELLAGRELPGVAALEDRGAAVAGRASW
jgi:phosphoglycerate kinase